MLASYGDDALLKAKCKEENTVLVPIRLGYLHILR
jgi:hypothetical protein